MRRQRDYDKDSKGSNNAFGLLSKLVKGYQKIETKEKDNP